MSDKYIVNVQFLVDATTKEQASEIVYCELKNAKIYKLYPYNTAGDTGITHYKIGEVDVGTV